MKLFVGLGNPGSKYLFTRHNAGFMILDLLAEKFGFAAPERKFEGTVRKGTLWENTVLLVKPETYMNLSGRCVSRFLQFYKIDCKDLIVIYDDLDLPPCKVKGRLGGGDGGHNGIKSIIAETGRADFHRIKIGIGRPAEGQGIPTDWVLNDFPADELATLRDTVVDEVLLRIKGIFQTADAAEGRDK